VHHYAFDHYAYWERTFTSVYPTVLAPPGAFGENVSTSGVTEADVCVGDVWRAGTALLQVSQGRQPCFKLNQRFELADMARRVQSSGPTGWYYRVVQPGTIGLGDPLRLVERTHPRWSLSRLLRVFYVDRTNRSELEEITALRALSPSWRAVAAKRLESGTIEDWALRLGGDLGGPVDVA
jgi:MOSC domain-containing protein YiiM